jgi:hypothetical protein
MFLFAFITQMGTSFKREILNEHIQEGLSVWHKKAKAKAKVKAKGRSTNKPDDDDDKGSIQHQWCISSLI